MRVKNFLVGSIKRPYIIVNLITIWSFLLTGIFVNAYPVYPPKAISPPSRLSCSDFREKALVAYLNRCIANELKKDKSFFWSGITGDVKAGNVTRAKDVAESISLSTGGVTLNRVLESIKIEMPDDESAPEDVERAWCIVSEIYAKNSSGEVHVILGKKVRPASVWEKVERMTILMNRKITKIIIIEPETKKRIEFENDPASHFIQEEKEEDEERYIRPFYPLPEW